MTVAVCPGSFDPVTNGHLDIIRRAAACFDEVVVGVMVNERKLTVFTLDERISFLEKATVAIGGVRVASFSGLLVDFCRDQGASVIVKGLRGAGDFEHELPMARMNHQLSGVETVYLAASSAHSFLSSSLVKEVAALGGDIAEFVPDVVVGPLRERLM
jgi:pantetheine-phosphate adenylyltransferase